MGHPWLVGALLANNAFRVIFSGLHDFLLPKRLSCKELQLGRGGGPLLTLVGKGRRGN